MNKAVISNRIYLTKTAEVFDKCIEALTYSIPSNRPMAKPEIVCDVVLISPHVFSIPVGRQDLIPEDYQIIDKRIIEWSELPEPKIQLREDQIDIFDQVEDNCLINAKPGYGKTFLSLHIAYKLAQKTLVVVHNTALRDQWEEEAEKVFGVKPGIIGTGRFESEPDIVISNTQTLGKYINDYSKMFGTLILDEVHRTPSATFKKILDASYARYKIGLSATLKRKDHKHVYIPDYFGPDRYIPSIDTAMQPTVTIIHTNITMKIEDYHHSSGTDHHRKARRHKKEKLGAGWAAELTNLCQKPEYIELIANIVNIKSNEDGHKVLCIGDRLDFLEEVHKLVPNSVKVTSETTDRREIHKEFYKENSYKSLIGTTSIYKEGISVNPLSCLVLGTPINNDPLLEQIIGRVTRPHPGKRTPEIIDIVLKGGSSRRQFGNRLNYYISKGYQIKEVHLD